MNSQPLLTNEWVIAFLLNFVLISFAQRFALLTKRGWCHAGILGTLVWGCIGWQGWLAVCIYLFLGSLVTKIGYAKKDLMGIAEARGGRRGPENVWGSAATGCCLVILSQLSSEYSTIFLIGFAASFTAKLADTFGSEIGKIYGRKAFLITTFRRVKPGVDGAISVEGTLASLAGSLLMGSVMLALSLIPDGRSFLIISLSGFLATILESFIGAFAQGRLLWLTNELVNSVQTTLSAIIAIFLSFFIF